MTANAITDLALATNLSSIPREFFTDYEEKVKPEFPSPAPSPLDFLLAKESGYAAKTEISDELCVLPSSFYNDGHGTYFISFPASSIAVREDIGAYVSPGPPEPHIPHDCYEILPKFLPIRGLDESPKYQSHGKRGRSRLLWKSQRVTIRKFLFST